VLPTAVGLAKGFRRGRISHVLSGDADARGVMARHGAFRKPTISCPGSTAAALRFTGANASGLADLSVSP